MKPPVDNDVSLNNKEEFIYYLKILNHIGYYDEMVSMISAANVENYNLNYSESVLMGSTFKNALNVRRKEKNVLENIIANEKTSEQEKNCAELLKYKLNEDIRSIENTTYDIIKTKCIPMTTNEKILMFYWHLLGDITRYCSDTFEGEEKKKTQERSMQSYSYALGYANRMSIPPSSPQILELLVSLTVLHKDMHTDINISIEMAAQAFRDAIQNMHLLENDDECTKTIGILGVLRDNINKWCELCGRKNVNDLFEIKGENFDKYKDIMDSIQS
ncbi:14-3-3 protein, putative [Plasmodium knowlesi strain H]|uniref:14-3-3 protein, putative n=3 Tax=Plasmodium knowlesi TaxID=5850 RepID=A0A5K1VQZ1_PLAKH|nr:14-3-3 protein, putative [Plasmodium knowlesi strain H]OTN64320.1 putative 14-3-3 protein [Plasmodium knowlesi]CAA9988921.1 14-3-3 protein, putative [Plasmodium knowlesi strain H]SBO24766.1 14-3-3 protein, putative [Plasmodium knowlesi strain H]SBO28030.1 14-3-3 protein, putative [Plasmodium knowlesi strain H]VVS78395.1 14-3-3 protein, putative [Plasmodium knowlesi strain H]|eukprot:XP_002261268.1 14-3-3 protein, putative [Plasmodium knowlesi strain H]